MKGQVIIPILSVLTALPLAAQTAEVQALDRAKETIAAADQTYHQQEAAVVAPAPALPAQPQFQVPSDQVVLDLPGTEEQGTAVAAEEETISVDFPEEDVRNIIRSVADLYELNVVIPDTLTGTVSVKLRNVSWQQVFNVVLEPLQYTYVVDGNIIKIKSQEELSLEPVDTRVFIIDFAKASEIRGSIEPLIDATKGGKIQVDSRSNALVITERPSRMNDIQEIIETLDRPTEQVMIESKFIEINDSDAENKGINWESLAGYGIQAGPFERVYNGSNGRNVGMDKADPASGSSTSESVSTSIIGGNSTTTVDTGSGSVTNQWYTNTVERLDTAVFSADAFSMVISALESMTDVELVSNPTVVTMNNFPAMIHIGEEYPIPNYTYNDERGTFEISDFEYKQIGITLDVTPQINSAGFINLNIKPEISTRTDTVNFGGASGAEIPIITARKTASVVTIKSGYTLAIGGLIQHGSINEQNRVPVIGSVPVIGRLFSSKNKSVRRTNLVVFITAKILSASGATYEDVFSPKTLHEMGVKSRDVPGYKPAEDEEQLYQDVLRQRDEVEKLEKEIKLREELQLLDSARKSGEAGLEQQASDPEGKKQRARRNYQ